LGSIEDTGNDIALWLVCTVEGKFSAQMEGIKKFVQKLYITQRTKQCLRFCSQAVAIYLFIFYL
jgi:hypothetical protein